MIKAKRIGIGFEIRTFKGKTGRDYIVFKTNRGGFHVFAEVEAKEAARDCGYKGNDYPRQMWKWVWEKR